MAYGYQYIPLSSPETVVQEQERLDRENWERIERGIRAGGCPCCKKPLSADGFCYTECTIVTEFRHWDWSHCCTPDCDCAVLQRLAQGE